MNGSTLPLEERARAFAKRFAAGAGEDLESIVYSPYPFSGGQLLIACKDRVPYLHELMAAAHPCDPPAVPTHWLRRSELGSLSQPYGSVFFWRELTGGYPGWAYWLRNEGRVLWGTDVRGSIPLPGDPRRVLDVAIGGCLTFNRHMLFLDMLVRERHAELVDALARLVRLVMATALLLHGVWQIDETTVAARFLDAFGADSVGDFCSQASALFGAEAGSASGPAGDDEQRRRAYEAVWLVERLVRLLRRYVE